MTTSLKLRRSQLTWTDERGLDDLTALTQLAEQLRPAGAMAVDLDRHAEGFLVRYLDGQDQQAGLIGLKRGAGKAWQVKATPEADWQAVPTVPKASRRRPS